MGKSLEAEVTALAATMEALPVVGEEAAETRQTALASTAREMKTRLKKVNEKRMMASVGGAGKKRGGGGGSLSAMNREDSNSSLNNTSTSGNSNNKAHASKREKKKFMRNRSKEDEERDILDIEDEMKAQLLEQGVLSTPTWKNLAVVILSKWAAKKAKELGAKAKAKASDLSKKKK